MSITPYLKRVLPRFALDVAACVRDRRASRPLPPGENAVRFTGDFASWAEASSRCAGYDAPTILSRTRAAMCKVRDGEARYERDSVLFNRAEYPFPLLTALLRVAVRGEGLSVLDFGGSLGSTWFQCRQLLQGIKPLCWSIVEQPAHVVCGQAEFQDETLRFYSSVKDCLQAQSPDVLLLSSVLAYLPQPYHTLAELLSRGFRHVIVDRTEFMQDGRSRLTVQQVPASIYEASYPAWFFSEPEFLRAFEDYTLVCDWPALDHLHPDGGRAFSKGFCFERKASAPRS